MRGGNTRSYPSFPAIEEQLGYNPARFLDTPESSEINDLSPLATVQAFIRGMEDVETVRAWIEVEVALEQGANGGPRKQVITWLNRRQAALNETDSVSDGPEYDDESSREDTTTTTDEPVEPTASGAEVSTTTALAADGGETPDGTPLCPSCRDECTREEIAGKVGFWCPHCQEFRKPITLEGRA